MHDFEFKRCTRRCSQTDREIGPGENYISALIESTDGIQRLDFAQEQWTGPPEGCIGWWKSRIPVLEKGKIYWAPNRVLLAFFESLVSGNQQNDTAYVMALLLVRKRVLQWKDTVSRDGVEFLQLRHGGEKKNFEVKTSPLSPEQIQSIQNELAEQLFTDQVEETSDEARDKVTQGDAS